MKKFFIKFCFCTSILISSFVSKAQPYSGTIFIDPDIITSASPTSFESIAYTGQSVRTVFDRRTNDWETIFAFLFEIKWDDGLSTEAQINPEFGDEQTAKIEAEKYGRLVGQLPTDLRVDVDALWIHKGVELFGGGNRSILIHTGQSVNYENDGILEETLVHEASHTSLDATHASSSGWLAAQTADPNFISTYARDNPMREDIAESFLTWLMVRHFSDRISTADFNKITRAIPNRLIYFDEQNFNLYPLVDPASSLEETGEFLSDSGLIVYPNPPAGQINFSLENDWRGTVHLKIINFLGQEVYRETIRKQSEKATWAKDISFLKKGIYRLMLSKESAVRNFAFVKS